MQTLPWIVALLAMAMLATGLGTWGWRSSRKARPPVLPTEWALTARPVFAGDERRLHRLLREALPQHVVLSKLPLVRFCQPTDPSEVRYWYNLLGNSHVTFAICSANGRVLAALDLDADRSESRRRLQIKQSVLSACRVRYLRCAVDQLPSVADLQLLVPNAVAGSRASTAEKPSDRPVNLGRETAHPGATMRREERTPLWRDSAVLQDSFFTPDSRLDTSIDSQLDSRLDSHGDAYGHRGHPDAGDFAPPAPAPAPRAKSKRTRRGALPGFDDTDFEPAHFRREADFDAEPSADDGDDFANPQVPRPRFFSSSRG